MSEGKISAISGNTAAALGAALCKPDVIAAYPITPQSSVVEYLAKMIADGKLNSTMIQVESEHSAMSVVQGAAAAGGRVFTATSAQGLALMYEPYFRMSTLRLPMVMAIACREMTSPETVWSGQQDAMSVRDAGWIQVFVENNQEILDTVIQGYALTEDKDVLVPVNVCYDGFYLSHLTERVKIPSQEQVNSFLKDNMINVLLDPDNPLALDPLTPGDILMDYRKSHLVALENVLEKVYEIESTFEKTFERNWGGLIEEYRCEDADVVLLTIGSMTGTARVAVDEARDSGIKVGLIKVRYMRPFPMKKIENALKGKKAWAAVDRSVCFGWNTGPLYLETRAAMADLEATSNFSVIGGLGGSDITLEHMLGVINLLDQSKNTTGKKDTVWLNKKFS